jgi:hypothetical protein
MTDKDIFDGVEVEPLDLQGEGFHDAYRDFLKTVQPFTNPGKVTVEDFDDAVGILKNHIVKPSGDAAKMKLLKKFRLSDYLALIEMIVGGRQIAVPPQSGGDSADISN